MARIPWSFIGLGLQINCTFRKNKAKHGNEINKSGFRGFCIRIYFSSVGVLLLLYTLLLFY